jgi:hypothetical protein
MRFCKGKFKVYRKSFQQSVRRGSALPLVIATVRDASEISARTAADTGLAKVLYEMNQKLEAGLVLVKVRSSRKMRG